MRGVREEVNVRCIENDFKERARDLFYGRTLSSDIDAL
jgi:hypothetical protein